MTCFVQRVSAVLQFTLQIDEGCFCIIQLNLPRLRSAIIFTEALCSIRQRSTEGFYLLPLGINFFAEHLLPSCERFYGIIVLIELCCNQLHFTAQHFEGLVDFGYGFFEFFFAFQPDLQTEIIRHLTTSYTPAGIMSSMNTSRFGLAIPLYCL